MTTQQVTQKHRPSKTVAIIGGSLAAWVLLAVLIAANNENHATALVNALWIPAVIVASVAFYWLPTYVAWKRHVRNLGSIAVLTFFSAFTAGITWIIALVMACSDSRKESVMTRPQNS